MLLTYLPLFFVLILISGSASKNFFFEVPNMGYYRGFLFLIASALASTCPFIIRFENNWYGLSQLLLTFTISNLALTIAIVEVTIWGQRVSLREKIRLNDNFFRQQKKIWKKALEGFPNSEKIISSLYDSRFVAGFFDRGSFNLAVLWSCNVMETVTDAAAEGIISKNPQRKVLFKKEDNNRRGYPEQLENLGYKPHMEKCRKEEQIETKTLWHTIRRDIAHYNYKPTFQETYGAMSILVSFMKEMPDILQTWK